MDKTWRYGMISQLIFRQRTQEYLMNTTQSWRVSNQIHKFIFSLSHFVVSPNDLCFSFLTWNLEISDFQYHQQIRPLIKSLKHINKTELLVFQKTANYLRKNQMWCYIFGICTLQDQHHMVHGLLLFFLALRTFFWTQTTGFLLFWLLTYLISMHKILFLFIRKQQEASCGIPAVRFHTQGNIRPGPNNTTSMGDPDRLERLLGATEPVFGLCLHFWVEKYTFSWACPTEE